MREVMRKYRSEDKEAMMRRNETKNEKKTNYQKSAMEKIAK